VTVSWGLARVGLTSAYIVGGTQSGIANVIAVTSDRGRSWLQMPSPCHASMTRIVPLGGGNMWLFCSGPGATIMADKQIFRSHSGGSAWTLVADTGAYQSRPRIGDLSLIGHLADVAVIDDQHAWIALSRDKLYGTADGGRTWQVQIPFDGELDSAGQVTFLDATHGFALAKDLWSTSDGVMWTKVSP